MSKLVSCDDFEGNPSVDEALEGCLSSKNRELRQRAFEYRKNPSGVVSISKIEDFDDELSFLQPQIEKAIRLGLGKYDRSKANTLLKKMKKKEQEERKNKLKTTHHKVDLAEMKKGNEKEGDDKWKGGSRDWVKKPPTEDQKKDSNNQKAKKIKFDFKDKKKEDAKTKMRMKAANLLFQNSGPATLKKPKNKGAVFKKPKMGDKKKKSGGNPFNKPKGASNNPGASPKQVESVDLLNNSPSQNTDVDLLNDTPASPSPFSKPKSGKPNPFSKPKMSQQAETLTLSPLQIGQSDFEEKWPSLEEEVFDESIPTKKVKTQKAFEEMTKAVGFHIVNAISNDNICAGQYGDHVVLMYGQYKLAGGLECRVRSEDEQLSTLILDTVKEYCKKN